MSAIGSIELGIAPIDGGGLALSALGESLKDAPRNLITDLAGNGLRFYHGTNQIFDQFREPRLDGIYFSTNPGYAFGYADAKATAFGGAPQLLIAHLRMANPLVIDGEDLEAWERYTQRGFSREHLIGQGFDGILVQYADGEIEAQALFADQVERQDPVATSETPAFWRWFDGSRVSKPGGQPLVVYHGTAAEFSAFESRSPTDVYYVDGLPVSKASGDDMGDDRKGAPDAYHYMAVGDVLQLGAAAALEMRLADARRWYPDGQLPPDTARLIADLERLQGRELVKQIETRPTGAGFYFTPHTHYGYIKEVGAQTGGSVMPVYLAIKNPIYLNSSQIETAGTPDRVQAYRRQGYDGAVFANDPNDLTKLGIGGATQIVAFDPEQVKSVFNRGTFDPAAANILLRDSIQADWVGDWVGPDASIEAERVVSSRGETDRHRLPNTNSAGTQVSATGQSLEQFWKWFEGSVTVDAAGRPLRLLHGTRNSFDKFEVMRATANTGLFGCSYEARRAGIFFTEDEQASDLFGENGNVMPVYVRMLAPADFRHGISEQLEHDLVAAGFPHRLLYNPSIQYSWERFDEEYGGVELVAALRRAGYDGAIIWDHTPQEEQSRDIVSYVVFDPQNIKSAIGNRGSFSPHEPSILMHESKRGESDQNPSESFGDL